MGAKMNSQAVKLYFDKKSYKQLHLATIKCKQLLAQKWTETRIPIYTEVYNLKYGIVSRSKNEVFEV